MNISDLHVGIAENAPVARAQAEQQCTSFNPQLGIKAEASAGKLSSYAVVGLLVHMANYILMIDSTVTWALML